MRYFHTIVAGLLVFGTASLTFAEDGPSIQGEPREMSQRVINATY